MKFTGKNWANLSGGAAPSVQAILDGDTDPGLKAHLRKRAETLFVYIEEAERRLSEGVQDRSMDYVGLMSSFEERLEELAVATVLLLDGQCGPNQNRVRKPLEKLLDRIRTRQNREPQYYQVKAERYVSNRSK